MRRILTVAVIGLLCIGGAANAQGGGPADIIKGRQGGMMLSGATMGAIKVGIDGNTPLQNQRFNTRALSTWAHAVPGMFPEGSGPEAGVRTNAKPEIWTDRAGFEAKAADYAAAADRLAELAQGEDAAAFSAQWTVVRASCQSCHDGYKN
jgi:cytochrome c556